MVQDPAQYYLKGRVGLIGSKELAERFDPVEETAQHVAALLLGVGEADANWLVAAGIPMGLVTKLEASAGDWLISERSPTALDHWTARLMSSFSPPLQPSGDEYDAQSLELQGWRAALEILGRRPWLVISWVTPPETNSGHLVLHDGAFGAALHFDDPDGPTLGGPSFEAMAIDWDDIPTHDEVASTEEVDEYSVDWVDCWGRPTPEPEQSDRLAVFTALRSSLTGADIAANDGYIWRARPAELAPHGGASAKALTHVFPTVRGAIDEYADMLSGESASAKRLGGVQYWHEPLWVVHRGDLPVLLFDEAGDVHMPSSAWLARAQDRAVLGSATRDDIEPWPASSFNVRRLIAAAEPWQSRWMAPSQAVVGDLLRAGAGYVLSYLGEGIADRS